jgi:hypothetical protein
VVNVKITSAENPTERWHLYTVSCDQEDALKIQSHLKPKFYAHFWKGDDVLVIFKDKHFWMSHFDEKTWGPAIEHGLAQGIPKEQLDFLLDE